VPMPVPEATQSVPIEGNINANDVVVTKEANSGNFFGVKTIKSFIGSIFNTDDGGAGAMQQLLADPKAVAAFQRFLETEVCMSFFIDELHNQRYLFIVLSNIRICMVYIVIFIV